MNAHSKLSLDRKTIFSWLADHFDRNADVEFSGPRNIEYLRLDEFDTTAIRDTLFLEVMVCIAKLGIRTHGTFGDLTQVACITQYDAHWIGCACNGEVVTGAEVARRIRSLIS